MLCSGPKSSLVIKEGTLALCRFYCVQISSANCLCAGGFSKMFRAPSEHPRLLDMKGARVRKIYPCLGPANLKACSHGRVNHASMSLEWSGHIISPDLSTRLVCQTGMSLVQICSPKCQTLCWAPYSLFSFGFISFFLFTSSFSRQAGCPQAC